MQSKFLSFVIICVFAAGCYFDVPAVEIYNSPFASEYSENIQPRRRRRVRRNGRLIVHRNSGRVRRAVCRDGSISLSRNRRGTCSHHGGVARWLR